MAYTKETGYSAAVALVKHNNVRFMKAQRNLATIAAQYCTDIPTAFFFAHLVRVNPDMVPAPEAPAADANPLLANTYGMFRNSPTAATDCGVSPGALVDPEMSAYVWCKTCNVDARYIKETYSAWFPASSEDFWRCAYARTALCDYTFDALVSEVALNSTHISNVWTHITNVVDTRKKGIGPLSILQLKKYVLFELEFVAQLAKIKGRLYSNGFGIEPLPSKRLMGYI